jgi:hypothetical protein
MADPRKILVVANETVVGKPLIEAVEKRAKDGPIRVHVVCPQNEPRAGYVVYDDIARDAAENRLKLTLAQLEEIGVDADGEVLDPDPFAATMDALADDTYDEIIISTHPETRSGWLRQGLVDRVARASGRPVEHIVVELDPERDDAKRTLVVANQTVTGEPLLDLLRKKNEEGPRQFIVILPQSSEDEGGSEEASQRLAHTLKELEEAGLDAVGQVVHPDPFTAVQNAIQFYAPDDIVISTFPETRSGWLRGDLIGRVATASGKPVEHVVVDQAEVKA